MPYFPQKSPQDVWARLLSTSSEGDPTRLRTDFSKPIGLPSHAKRTPIQIVAFKKPQIV
jgi:hypothetical protein